MLHAWQSRASANWRSLDAAENAVGRSGSAGNVAGQHGRPMQRPERLGTRTTLTDEEFAQKEAQAKKQAQADSRIHRGQR